MARKASTKPNDSAANLGFEATAWRGAAFRSREATMRSPQGNRRLAANNLRSNMVALPGQRFYSKQIPVCFGFLAEN